MKKSENVKVIDAEVKEVAEQPKTEKKGILVRGATKVENGLKAIGKNKWKILGGIAGLAALGGLGFWALRDKDDASDDVIADVVPEVDVSEGEEL